jgi:hypothetical protein
MRRQSSGCSLTSYCTLACSSFCLRIGITPPRRSRADFNTSCGSCARAGNAKRPPPAPDSAGSILTRLDSRSISGTGRPILDLRPFRVGNVRRKHKRQLAVRLLVESHGLAPEVGKNGEKWGEIGDFSLLSPPPNSPPAKRPPATRRACAAVSSIFRSTEPAEVHVRARLLQNQPAQARQNLDRLRPDDQRRTFLSPPDFRSRVYRTSDARFRPSSATARFSL